MRLKSNKHRLQADWFPYVSVQQNLLGTDAPDSEDVKVGLDFIWRPNSSTQLTGAINPDFGQVESDDLVVNFSAYETLLEEKRPFFTENQPCLIMSNPMRIGYYTVDELARQRM